MACPMQFDAVRKCAASHDYSRPPTQFLPMMKPSLLKLILAGAFFAPAIASTYGEDLPLSIAVRSEIDRPFEGWGRAAVKEHGKAYLIASINEGRSEQPLVMPVDESALLDILRGELTKRGFQEVTDTKPEIILTVLYGRGYLRNPYLDGAHIDDSGDPPTVSISMANVKYLQKRQEYGYLERLQEANHEKLFIRVTAWSNPADVTPKKSGGKVKPKELWHTTMITDDPGHRDLNQFMKKLLAAGSSFFDREMDDDEEFITTDLPEGFIEYGDTIIMDDK